jgi:hypothetical protein
MGIRGSGDGAKSVATSRPAPRLPPNAFVGTVRLDPTRVVKDVGRVAVEALEQLSTLPERCPTPRWK